MKHNIWNEQTNMSMLTDFYEFTMSNGYMDHGLCDKIACFDLYFRRIPDSGGYAIMAGVEQMIDFLTSLNFDNNDIDYLRSQDTFSEDFLTYLQDFKFECDIWCVPEGMPIFPNEPIVKVRGPIVQAQMIETMLLVTINHQCLIATKSSRIVRSAIGRAVMEFGARRAHGYDASVLGARAAYISGVTGTSNTLAAQQFDIPCLGTMAHSWVQAFDDEYEAFRAYALSFPDNCLLLVDTYNTLKSGLPNAIRIAKEVLEPMGKRLKGIRIDSGDLAYLTIESRRVLDEAGLQDCKITVSNSMDEYLIRNLIHQGAQIDSFGVGERLITSKSEPVFGGVYKLCAIGDSGDELEPRMKISDNPDKVTNPGCKELWRFYDRASGKALADLITLEGEIINEDEPYEIFDPFLTWKRKTLINFRVKKLLEPVFEKGRLVYERRKLSEIREFCLEQQNTLYETMKRFENPQLYFVDLSQDLWDLKESYLRDHSDI
ncbi:MAG TPA: nicotinate phosphoribosyltransferase [Clostridiaceae bacterium]|nr:nicotinate phosphoribosyltransferase [Clostridiaceae bacterium]